MLVQSISLNDGGLSGDGFGGITPETPDVATPMDAGVAQPIVRNARGLQRRYRWNKNPLANQRSPQTNRIVLKLVDNTGFRITNGQLTQDPAIRTADDQDRIRGAGLDPTSFESDSRQLLAVLASDPTIRFYGPSTDASILTQARAVAEQSLGHEIADSSAFITLEFQSNDPAVIQSWLTRLRALPMVETAYPDMPTQLPRTTAACADQLPTTVGFAGLGESNQRYIRPRPSASQWFGLSGATRLFAGIDVISAWSVPGGTGTGAKVFDVEVGFTEEHEDLPNITNLAGGQNINDNFIPPMLQTRHGTATMGVLVGCRQNPDFGFTGIAHSASGYFSGTVPTSGPASISGAINRVINSQLPILPNVGLAKTILLEQEFSGSPVETVPANFAAIQTATGLGYTVVEPTGNGDGCCVGLLLDNMTAGGGSLVARYPGDPAFSGALMVGAVTQDATINGRHLTANYSGGGSRVDLSAWGAVVDTVGYPGSTITSINFPNATSGEVNGPNDANQWYTGNYGGSSSASAIIAGAATSVWGMAIAAGSTVPTPVPWAITNILKRTALPSDPSLTNPAVGPRNGGPTLQLGMVASVFAERSMPVSVNNTFSSKLEATQVQLSQVHVQGVRNSGEFVHNVLQGGAWHGWRTFPTNNAGINQLQLTDSTPTGATTPVVDAWGLDLSGRLIWSQRTSGAVGDYSAWVLGDTLTGLQHITTTVYDANYVNGFAVTGAGQLRWYYRPINSASFFVGSPAFPTAATLATKIVAVPSRANPTNGRPARVDLFARNTSGQLVHAWVSGSSFFGWNVVRPAETDVGQIDAVYFSDVNEEVIVAYGRAQSTTIGRLAFNANVWSWSSVNVTNPRGVALAAHNVNGPQPGSARLFVADSSGMVKSFTILSGSSWTVPQPAGTSTWTNTTNYSLARAQYLGTSLVFAVPPGGTPVYRASDSIFPRL